MQFGSRLRSAFRNLFFKKRAESELDSELRAYVETVTEERIAAGMPAQEARRSALADFGGVEQVKQAVRDHRAGTRVELMGRDVRYGLRQLRRNPGFALTVMATLALAIGANTAAFSLINSLMLKRLPYPQPERLGTIFRVVQGGDNFDGMHSINGGVWRRLRDEVPALLSAVSSRRADGVNLEAGKHVEYVHAGRVSAQYLNVLGVHPALGRNFSSDEDRPHGPKAVILSYHLWQNTFGGDASLLGQTIHLKGDSYTVVGVLPAGAMTPLNADLYTALQPSSEGEGAGSNYGVTVRLRDGATWSQADAEVNRVWVDWARELAKEEGPGVRVSFRCVPLQQGRTAVLRPQVTALMIASGFILLIACANLAGLTMVRIARRTPEMATRLALGGSHWQIQRQLWIENLMLAFLGGSAGVGLAFLALHGLLALLPVGYLPVTGVPLDGTVLAFTLVVSIFTSLLFGMLPALVVRGMNLRSSMIGYSLSGGARTGLRQVLIAGEVALTVVLLAGSGLLIRTLIHLETLPPGFNPKGVMAAKASLDDARYHDPAAFRKLLNESIDAMERIPGVESAAVGLSLPYEEVMNSVVGLDGGQGPGQLVQADMLYVTPGYFATLQIPLVAGRDFGVSDGPVAQRAVIVNRSFVQKFYKGVNPVGRILRNGPGNAVIVGVVGDVQLSSGLNWVAPLESEETVYMPAAQMASPADLTLVHTWYQTNWVVRTAHPVAGLTEQMQHAMASADPGLPFSGFYSMSDLEAKTLATQRVQVALLVVMAGLALLLSAVGIFALVASSVTQRTREIGIRIALGSTVSNAIRHLAAVGMLPVFAGLLLGLAACAGALRVMRGVLYGVGVYDAPSGIAVVGLLMVIALLAATIPAMRIARIDPAKTLREE